MLKKSFNQSGNIYILATFILSTLVLSVMFFNQSFLKNIPNDRKDVLGEKTQIKKLPSPTAKSTSMQNLNSTTPIPTPTLKPTQSSLSKNPRDLSNQIYLGFWTQGLWDDPNLTFNPSALKSLEGKINKKSSIAHFYTGWSNLSSERLLGQLNLSSSNGWRPMISANPYFFDKCQASGKSLYKTIADGDCDALLTEIANNLKKYEKPLLLRFAWEMNIDSMEWSIQKTKSTPGDYINAWRRFHQIAKNLRAGNISWVFCPNVDTPSSIPINSLYPGSEYVNWLGMDGYNWGKTQSWSSWQTFTEIFSPTYQKLVKMDKSKPIMIGETNSTDIGGDKSIWYKDSLNKEILNFPQIKAVIFYNENRQAKENVNWLIDINDESLKSFSSAISSPIYKSSF